MDRSKIEEITEIIATANYALVQSIEVNVRKEFINNELLSSLHILGVRRSLTQDYEQGFFATILVSGVSVKGKELYSGGCVFFYTEHTIYVVRDNARPIREFVDKIYEKARKSLE